MPRPKLSRELTEAYLSQYITFVDDAVSCWPWHGPVNPAGFGVVYVAGQLTTALKASARLWRPDIYTAVPDDKRSKVRITHIASCKEQKLCCRPDHLCRKAKAHKPLRQWYINTHGERVYRDMNDPRTKTDLTKK